MQNVRNYNNVTYAKLRMVLMLLFVFVAAVTMTFAGIASVEWTSTESRRGKNHAVTHSNQEIYFNHTDVLYERGSYNPMTCTS